LLINLRGSPHVMFLSLATSIILERQRDVTTLNQCPLLRNMIRIFISGVSQFLLKASIGSRY
jgi:hypothetical protein